MTIESVEAIPYRLPTRAPVRFANGEVTAAEHVLVRIRCDDGLVGVAEASPRPMTYGDTAPAVVDAVQRFLAPLLVGKDERAIERLHRSWTNLRGMHTARAAVDIALWDLLGKRAGLPVAALLGGFSDRVAVAHLVGLGTPRAMAEECAGIQRDRGVGAFKVKVGLDSAGDIERITAVREAVGQDAIVYADANHGWSAEAALRVVDATQAALNWVEEPNPSDDHVGRRWLIERLRIPVVADESARDRYEAAHVLREGLAQWVSLKAGRTGFAMSRDIVGLVRGLGARAVVGSQIEGALGVVASLHLAAAFDATARCPAELTSALEYAEDILDPPEIVDGWMQIPDAPGLGVEIDEGRLDALRIT